MRKDYIFKEMDLQYERIGVLLDGIKNMKDEDLEYRESLKEAEFLLEKLLENCDYLHFKDKYKEFKTKVGGMKWGKRS